MIALALLSVTVPVLPVDIAGLTRDAVVTGGGVAMLHWTHRVTLAVEPGDDEVVVRFDRPLDEAGIAAFRRDAGAGLARFEWNDDSLVMRAAPGRTLTVTPQGDALLVTIRAETAPGAGAAEAPAVVDDPVPYALAAAGADTAAGYPGRAHRRVAALAKIYPDDARVRRALADGDAVRGAAGRAATGYRALDADDPVARRTIRDAGGEASIGASYRDGSGFSQFDATGRVAVAVSRATTAAVAVRQVHTRADALVGRDGVVRSGRADSTNIELGANVVGERPVRVEAAMLVDLSDPRVAFRGRLFHGYAEGEARLVFAYRVPEFQTAEQALFGGHASRIGGGFTARLSPAVQARGDVGLNRYGLRNEARLVDSTTLSGGLDLILTRGSPDIVLLYRLDAEYVGRQVLRPGGLPALAYFDRENHTGQLLVARDVGAVRLAAAGGWTFDRYGSDGPTATVTVGGAIGEAWRFDLGGGVTSIQQPNLPGTQIFARGTVSRSLGRP